MEKDGGRDNFSWNFKIAKNRQGGKFGFKTGITTKDPFVSRKGAKDAEKTTALSF